MAITYIPFIPSLLQAPSFQVTLDGNIYNVTVTWNLAAQRYYINITQLDGTLVLCRALIGSPVGVEMESAVWKNGTVTVKTQAPHTLQINATLNLTIEGVTPDGYNGQVSAFIIDQNTFTYLLSADPGKMTVTGSVSQNLDLIEGYFTTSTLVFRTANSQFEVT